MTISEITFTDVLSVEAVRIAASDTDVITAARVSTKGSAAAEQLPDVPVGLIRYLMRNRHGTPFEHNQFTFRVHAPIFVFRELFRHRIASVNEESGRYREMEPVFHITAPARPIVQEGKPSEYRMVPGTVDQLALVHHEQRTIAVYAFASYRRQLEAGIAREVSREVLPLSLYSSAYFTINARSLMNLLSLRINHPDNTYDTNPLYEIQQLAEQMETTFARAMPLTHAAFVKYGRVAP